MNSETCTLLTATFLVSLGSLDHNELWETGLYSTEICCICSYFDALGQARFYKMLEGPLNLELEDLSSSFHYATENNNSSALLISPGRCKAQKYFVN